MCGCVRDVDSNGVKAYVELTAFKIRYPGITSGNETLTNLYLTERQKREASPGKKYIEATYRQGTKKIAKPRYNRAALLDFNFDGEDYEVISLHVFLLDRKSNKQLIRI